MATQRVEARPDWLKRYLVGIGVALTVGFLTQTVALVYWCAKMETRMEYVERDVAAVATMHIAGGTHP